MSEVQNKETTPGAPRVRFAPSPTGYLHVGGARTALFNWLFARHTGGKFLLRIEDTDVERSTEESTLQILESLEWLGLQADEPAEYQSRRSEKHRQYLERLTQSGHAYRCYCSKERLDELREQAKRAGKPFVYDKRCTQDHAWVKNCEANRDAFVVRFRVPDEGVTVLDDMVYGPIEFENRLIGDFVIARGDGTPMYNFTNAVDDLDMQITHVCRGEDHVSNTPKQMLIYQALGCSPPRFAHLPLILGPDKTRLSKRHGATSVMQFRDNGILPQALVNFLALLGWSPDTDEEVMPLDDLIAKFALEKVNKSAAVFDYEKLLWMNGVYIRNTPPEKIYEMVIPLLQREFPEKIEASSPEWLRGIIDLEIERSRTLNDFAQNLVYFFVPPESYDEKGARKFLGTPEQVDGLRNAGEELLKAWDALPPEISEERAQFNAALDAHMRSWAEQRGIKFGQAVHPIRIATTGRTASPGLFDVLYYLGKSEVRRRIESAVAFFSTPAQERR